MGRVPLLKVVHPGEAYCLVANERKCLSLRELGKPTSEGSPQHVHRLTVPSGHQGSGVIPLRESFPTAVGLASMSRTGTEENSRVGATRNGDGGHATRSADSVRFEEWPFITPLLLRECLG